MSPIFAPCWTTYEEGDEDRSVHKNQAKNGRPAVSENVRDGTGHEDTNESTALTGLEERRLPFRLDGVDLWHDARVGDDDAVSLLEVKERDEVAVQEHVEGLHDAVHVLA
jgi:hypothetical protein